MPVVTGATSWVLTVRAKIAAALALAKQLDDSATSMAGRAVPPINIRLVLKMPGHPIGTGKVLQRAATQLHRTRKHRPDGEK
jgi:hypothetical protein